MRTGASDEEHHVVRSVLKYFAPLVVLSLTLLLSWLHWNSGRPRDNWFSERHGRIETIAAEKISFLTR